jgi:hypothetical protein
MTRPYKYRVWNGREMVSPDYIDRDGLAHWKEDSVQCQSPRIFQFIGIKDEYDNDLYADDIIEDDRCQKYRIYAMPGGFGIKAPFWAPDMRDLNDSDYLIMQPIANIQTASYIKCSCHKIGTVLQNPELLQQP